MISLSERVQELEKYPFFMGESEMATHPYISGPGNIAQMVHQLRKSFPSTISSETVKKLGLAPNNESYVINVLQYIGVIDAEGKKTTEAAKVFSHHKDEDFAKHFSNLVEKAYASLFELHGPSTWSLDSEDLITFFRQSDQTSSTIGGRQAGTFKVLAGLAGHGDIPEPKTKKANGKTVLSQKASVGKQIKNVSTVVEKNIEAPIGSARSNSDDPNFGLTVRVEINLPADGSKETYDNIFKSIKENLLGG